MSSVDKSIMEELIAKYLADEMTEEQRKEFEQQLLSDDQLQEELYLAMSALHLTEEKNNTQSSFNASQAWSKVAQELQHEPKTVPLKPRYSFLKIAASIIAIGALIYLGLQNTSFKEELSTEIMATQSEVKEFNLPDGSVVFMNANSSISYEDGFGTDHRRLELKGGANFDVVRNESLPFVIKTTNSEVQVLGTSFEVMAYADRATEVNVSSGKVGLKATKTKADPIVLEAGNMARLSADGTQLERGTLKNNNHLGWWTRELVFDQTSLKEVAQDLNKTYWSNIEVAESVANCQISQIVRDKTLEDVLEILQATLPGLTITRDKENRIKLDGNPCTD